MMHCCDKRGTECIFFHKDGDVSVKDLLRSADNTQVCKNWGIRIYAFFLVEVGLVVALCLWIEWLTFIPMVLAVGDGNFGSTMVLATSLNLALCVITTGVIYAIWKYYLGLVLLLLGSVMLYFPFFSWWYTVYKSH